MAVNAFPYLVMTDGTDTVTFADGSATNATGYWPLVRSTWGPAIAGIRTSQLGGRGPYADVEEDLTCNIRGLPGNTAAVAYQNLDTLTRLLDKAERWWLRNEPISPVLLKYAPQGSTLFSTSSPLLAIVLGRVGSDELNGVQLPQSTNDTGFIFEIDNVQVLCMRRGAWWGGAQESATSSSAANPTVMTCTFATTHPINSPCDVSISGFTKATTPIIRAGYVLTNSASGGMQIVEAEGAASGTFTSVADAANNARGGNVLRFTPGVTTAVTSGTISGLTTVGGTIAILAAVRNNSATTSFIVTANMSGLGTVASSTPGVLVDTSSVLPRLVLLGTLVNAQANKLSFTVQASAASGTLDIDYVVISLLKDETCAIISYQDVDLTNLGAGAATLDIVFNPTTAQQPAMQVSGTGGSIPATYSGALPLLAVSNTMFVVWASTNGASWRFTNVTPAVVSVAATAARYKAFLSPQ